MYGNEMSVAFENRVFNKRSGLSGSRMACTLVTGFLGSGKTTLMKHILDNRGDLRIALLVNEFADSDVDSLLLNSTNLNAAFNLSTVSLSHGCACCNVSGPFKESLQRIVDSKHNFDCLLIETSGLAEPNKFVAQLEEVGIHLDLTVAVVDAESLHKILTLDIVKQQLEHVDLVLLNKCDLGTLGQISDAEDIIEGLTGGAKVVRSQFCKVPLDLVIDHSKAEAPPILNEEVSAPPVLSHEALPKMSFQRYILNDTSVVSSSSALTIDQSPMAYKRSRSNDFPSVSSHQETFSSVSFESEVPLSLASFQSTALSKIRNTKGLLRAKGIIWLEEDRENRYVFQWSGVKRVEAVSGGPWESAPKSCLVLIGTHTSELEDIKMELVNLSVPQTKRLSCSGSLKELTRSFRMKVVTDGRFKEPRLDKEPLVIFGLKGSPLRGITETTVCSFCFMKTATLMKPGMKSEWPLVWSFQNFAKISALAGLILPLMSTDVPYNLEKAQYDVPYSRVLLFLQIKFNSYVSFERSHGNDFSRFFATKWS